MNFETFAYEPAAKHAVPFTDAEDMEAAVRQFGFNYELCQLENGKGLIMNTLAESYYSCPLHPLGECWGASFCYRVMPRR